jgi:hypothetical protein
MDQVLATVTWSYLSELRSADELSVYAIKSVPTLQVLSNSSDIAAHLLNVRS